MACALSGTRLQEPPVQGADLPPSHFPHWLFDFVDTIFQQSSLKLVLTLYGQRRSFSISSGALHLESLPQTYLNNVNLFAPPLQRKRCLSSIAAHPVMAEPITHSVPWGTLSTFCFDSSSSSSCLSYLTMHISICGYLFLNSIPLQCFFFLFRVSLSLHRHLERHLPLCSPLLLFSVTPHLTAVHFHPYRVPEISLTKQKSWPNTSLKYFSLLLPRNLLFLEFLFPC